MSDTRRHVQVGWNPTHPRWPFGSMTQKYQEKDRPSHNNSSRHRFCNLVKNSKYNLERKIDELRYFEALKQNE